MKKPQKKFGTTNIPVNTFNKVWIVPEKAVVYENAKAGTAYVVEAKLKVMLEQDYLALSHNVILAKAGSRERHQSLSSALAVTNASRLPNRPRDRHPRIDQRSQRRQKLRPTAPSLQQSHLSHLVQKENQRQHFSAGVCG